MQRVGRSLLAVGIAVGAWVAPALASDMMGAYCIVDKVVFDAAPKPERAQIWGTCATAIPERGGLFDRAARGYFYYTIPFGQADTARTEWADLKSVAGTGEVVSFGARYKPMGRFRGATEALGAPDPYPLNVGVVKLGVPTRGRFLFNAPETGKMIEELKSVAAAR